MDALYAEAERVVRRATELEEQAMREGPGSYPTELHDLLADPYLAWSQAGVAEYQRLGWQQPEGESAEFIFRAQPGRQMDGSEFAIQACLFKTGSIDAHGTVIVPPETVVKSYFFKHVDGDMRLFTSTLGEGTHQCPFE